MQPADGKALKPERASSAASWEQSRWWPIVCACALVIVTFIAYRPALEAGFIWDDDSYLTDNQLVQSPDGLRDIWALPFQRDEGLLPIPQPNTPQYYPLVFTTFWVEHKLWELNPRGYHFVNILLHALNALLVWLIFKRLGIHGAWLIGALFALHPVHVESVAWITERKNVLSGFFYLAAAWCWLRFDEDLEKRPEDRHGSPWTWAIATMALFMLALFSKTITCSLPAALVLIMLFRRRSFTAPRLVSLAPMFLLGLVAAWITRSIELHHVGAIRFADELAFSLPDRIVIASNALLFYVWKLIVPYPLVFIYPRWNIDDAGVLMWLPVPVVLAAGAGLVWLYLRDRRGIPLACAYFAGTALPALGLLALVYPHRFSFVADHFNYLSSLGILALVAVGILNLPVNTRLRIVLAALVLCASGIITMRQSLIYRDAETLWLHTVKHNPTGWMPQNNLSALYLRQAALANQGGHAEQRIHFAELARQHAAAAVRIKPDHHTAHNNLSGALRLLNRAPDALAHAIEAAELAPHLVDYQLQVARLARILEMHDRAVEAYERAVEASGGHREVRLELADYLAERELYDRALQHVRHIVDQRPDDFRALLLAAGLQERRSRYDQTDVLYMMALRAAQGNGDLLLLLLPRMARFYANCPDPAYRDDERAMAAATDLVRLTQADPQALAILGDVHFQAGRLDAAVQALQQAALRARQRGDDELATSLEQRIVSYRSQAERSEPLRDSLPIDDR